MAVALQREGDGGDDVLVVIHQGDVRHVWAVQGSHRDSLSG